jgi:hypothetical protein
MKLHESSARTHVQRFLAAAIASHLASASIGLAELAPATKAPVLPAALNAPHKLPPQIVDSAILVELVQGEKVIATQRLTNEQPAARITSKDGKVVATASVSANVVRDAKGHPLTAAGNPRWKCYGSIAPVGPHAHGNACVLVDGAKPSADATLSLPDGDYTVRITKQPRPTTGK